MGGGWRQIARKAHALPGTERRILSDWRARLQDGLVIPAHPLALGADRTFDERRQRALTRYYLAAGAGGIAVGVHTTQFRIREHGLFEPVLRLVRDTVGDAKAVMIAGISGPTARASDEAKIAADLGYDVGLVSLAGMDEPTDVLVDHVRAVAEIIPVMGFYLQPAVGGRNLSQRFWERFLEVDNVVGIKIAPFDRYRTLDVIRAVARSGRASEIALYTGNDDSIVQDLVTPFVFNRNEAPLRMVGGLLGQWSMWTHRAVALHRECRDLSKGGHAVPHALLTLAAQLTAANAAIFDVAHDFAGCIPGIHEVLRRQGLLSGTWCLNPDERLSEGQQQAIDRAIRSYPWLTDDDFVREHLDEWLA